MNFSNFDFKKDYQIFLNFLYSKQDLNYLKFHSKLLKDSSKLIGIRVPILKEIAKEIAKSDYQAFFQNNTHSTYEEIMLHGLVIGYLKCPFNEVLELLSVFIPFVDNWAVNDVVCANLKVLKKNQDEGFQYIKSLINSKNEWQIRFGLVLLLDFYINDRYIDQILEIANQIKSKEYYVKMANAWLVSICFIKYETKTYKFLLKNKLDEWTYHKAISKICDSYRVDKETKEKLKTLKNKYK